MLKNLAANERRSDLLGRNLARSEAKTLWSLVPTGHPDCYHRVGPNSGILSCRPFEESASTSLSELCVRNLFPVPLRLCG
jgi:hypothetical protein